MAFCFQCLFFLFSLLIVLGFPAFGENHCSVLVRLLFFFLRFSKDSFFWLQRLAFIAHCSLVYLFHFFSQLPDTFFPQSSHIALELFSPVSSRQVGAFSQTSRHLQSHLAKLFYLHHNITPVNCQNMSQPILLRVEALSLTKAYKSSFPAGVFPATGDPAAPTCRALLSPQDQTHTVYYTQTHTHTLCTHTYMRICIFT